MSRIGFLLYLLTLALAASAEEDVAAYTPLTAEEFASLLEAKRGQVVLINLWATWCAPCLEEIPELERLEAALPVDEFALVPIAMDDPGTGRARVEDFVERHFPGFDTYLSAESDMDTLVSVVDPAWNEIMPTSYVVGRDGRVLKRIQGRKDQAGFLEALEPALAE